MTQKAIPLWSNRNGNLSEKLYSKNLSSIFKHVKKPEYDTHVCTESEMCVSDKREVNALSTTTLRDCCNRYLLVTSARLSDRCRRTVVALASHGGGVAAAACEFALRNESANSNICKCRVSRHLASASLASQLMAFASRTFRPEIDVGSNDRSAFAFATNRATRENDSIVLIRTRQKTIENII